ETPPNPDSFFGAHAEQQNPDFHLAFVKKLGAKWVRCHDIIQMTWWEIVEPEDDRWNWRDEQCATIRKHGFHILGEFCMTPAWAARVPESGVKDRRDLRTYPPKSWDEYAEYVYETVNHFKRDVRHWEVWNEPNHSGFWRGTPEEYAHLLKVTHQAAKKADPTCVIVGVGGVALSQMPWLERAFAAGLASYMDDMSTHGYVDAVTPMDMLETESRLPAFRALLRKHDFKGGLWDSEHSVIGTSFIDDFRLDHLEEDAPYHFRRAAETMMKTYVFEVAQGYKRVFPYMTKWLARNDNEAAWRARPLNQNLFDVYGTPKPMAVAHATTAYMMEGSRYRETLDLSANVQVYVYERGADLLACYWGRYGKARTQGHLRLPAPKALDLTRVERVDIMGNHHAVRPEDESVLLPLSPEPVWLWFHGQPSAAVIGWLKQAR
ncbi:MAG: hypothetical protein FJ279_36990, partial [Planctomycetes bacterium]|nr:hypothetical protein [Planctomycetota bacterium]